MASKRLTLDETRSAVLAAGLTLLEERGPSVGLDRVTFANAIEAADVPRPSAYRAFSDDVREPQEHFRHELALRVIELAFREDSHPLDDAMQAYYDQAAGDEQTSQSLTWLLREAVRTSANSYVAALADSTLAPFYVTIVMAEGRVDSDIRAAAEAAERAAAVQNISAYKQLASSFGLRLRRGWTWEAFSTAITKTWVGDHLLESVGAHQGPILRPTGPNDDDVEWSCLAVIIEALIAVALEPNPRMRVAARPHLWNAPQD